LKISKWIIHRNAVSDGQQDSIQKIENRFSFGGIVASDNIKIEYKQISCIQSIIFDGSRLIQFLKFDSFSKNTYVPRFARALHAAHARHPHPAIKATPPNGVIAPNHFSPLILSM
jgi:hypothetical protein